MLTVFGGFVITAASDEHGATPRRVPPWCHGLYHGEMALPDSVPLNPKRKKPSILPCPVEGEVWAVPLPKLGYCPFVVARSRKPAAEVDFAFGYLQPTLYEELPAYLAIEPLADWEAAWIGLVPTLPFRKGRWIRCGSVPCFDLAEWPVVPSRSPALCDPDDPNFETTRWSIETTPDEATMTLVSNEPSTADEAIQFPPLSVATSASSFEKALAKFFRGLEPGFWDMHVPFHHMSAESVRLWNDYSEEARADAPPTPEWLPAGRRTDRSLRAGAWLTLPLNGGGFGAARLVAKPEKHERVFSDAVIMGIRRRWPHWPSLDDVASLTPDDAALVGQTSMICVRDGRWRVLGYHEPFDPIEWVWPRRWSWDRDADDGATIVIRDGEGNLKKLRVDPATLALDPHAGERCAAGLSYSSFECRLPEIVSGSYVEKTEGPHCEGVVTPERLAAWREINAAIQAAVDSPNN